MGLFNLNDRIKICKGVDVKLLSEEDEALFLEYLGNNDKERISFYASFYYLFPLSESGNNFKYYYCILDNYLCIYEYSKYTKLYSIKTSPINKNGDYTELGTYFIRFIGILSKLNGGKQIASKNVIKVCNIVDYELFVNRRSEKDYKEFVFLCSDLINLQGKPYKTRRHMVNKFKTDNPTFEFRAFAKDDYNSAMAIYEAWILDYKKRYPKESICNSGLFEITLKRILDGCHNYDAFVCAINGKVEGIIVLTPLCKDTCSVLLEYTNLNIVGMTEFMWYESLRNVNYLYENDGTGGPDSDGLFFYKNSHKPIMFLETRTISLNKKGSPISKKIIKGVQ